MNWIYNNCVISLDVLLEAAEQGSPGAAECLRDIADRLQSRAAVWER